MNRVINRSFRVVLCAMGALALCSMSASAAAGPFNIAGVEHNGKYVKTKNNAAVQLLDIHGNPLRDPNGNLLPKQSPKYRDSCPGDGQPCLRFQGIEKRVTASGKTLYYTWEFDSGAGDRPGFVSAADLESPPTVDISKAKGNGTETADATGSPMYRLAVQDISESQGYPGITTPGP